MRSEWKSLGIQLHHIFGLPISRPCQIVLFILADSTDHFNPSIRHIGKITNMDSSAVSKILKTLVSLNYIIRNGLDSKGRSKWLITIETIKPLVSHLTSCTTDSTSTNSCLTDSRGAVPQTAGVLYHRQHEPLRNPKINPKEVAAETLPPPVKKPPRPHLVELAKMWYDITPPTDSHNKDEIIDKWARELQTEQNVTKYTNEQMTQLVTFRNGNDFWRLKGARRPGGLAKKGINGARKTVNIYEASCSEKPRLPSSKPVRLLKPGELPF